ncbi:hypothetical protein LSH36_43g05002 [Paralvinella palmiformis]|uniref:Cytochrome c oxidase assembly protein COX20, mitochondrial n=1 Tax=Paralvinella palmiformis TaxID=53620 RepID=A0AAD9NDI8_9ANNE|nr:hypothetical protein LSH36_43g05002 [Paralvinella palmiformis]
MTEEEKPSEGTNLFGKELKDVPCLRSSLVFGILGGMTVAFASFMSTSNARKSLRRGFASYCGFTVTAWIICRSNYSMKLFRVMKIKDHIPKRGDDV